MFKIWQNLSQNGVQEVQLPEVRQNIIIVNRIAVVAGLLALPFLVIYIQIQNLPAIACLLALYIFNVIGLFIIQQGSPFWGRFLVWFNSATITLLLSAIITPSNSPDTFINKLLLMSFIPLVFMIFNRREFSVIIFLLLSGIFAILAFDWINDLIEFSSAEFAKPNVAIRLTTIVFSLSLIISSSIYYKNLQGKYAYQLQVAKQKSDNLLLNILPKDTVNELKEKGYSEPDYYKLATVLFTDFKGFTKLSEKISPTEVIEELHYCFTAFDEICRKYSLERIKTIRDAYMAVGGIPNANTTNPSDAVRAGLRYARLYEKMES